MLRGSENKVDFDSMKSKLVAKNEELSDARARFDRLQGSKERVEAELLQSVKQRREAQLSWTVKRTELEDRLQVFFCYPSCRIPDVCQFMTTHIPTVARLCTYSHNL
jgi:hypothetical protein